MADNLKVQFDRFKQPASEPEMDDPEWFEGSWKLVKHRSVEIGMTIVAEVLRGLGPREPLAKVKLAALPRVGDNLHIDDNVYEVAAVDHFAVNAEQQVASGLPVIEGEPFVLIIVNW